MRPAVASACLAAVFGLAAAQELPKDIEFDDLDLDDVNFDDIEAPEDVKDELPSGIDPSNLPSEVPSGITLPTAAPSGDIDNESLPGLVDQLPRCAVECLKSSAEDNGCSTTDFECLCNNAEQLGQSVGACVVLSSECDQDDAQKAATIAPQICKKVSDNPDPEEVASASSIVDSAVESGSPDSDDDDDNGSSSATTVGSMGLFGTVMLMALAF